MGGTFGAAVKEGEMLVGESRLMSDLRTRVDRIAGTAFTVLVEGESGAGKELVANQLHQRSPRRRGPFVAVNCAAIVETLLEAELFGIEERTATGVRGRRGKFEMAHEGTLFLDEVADLSLTAQAKLLRVLQDMTVERVGAVDTRRVDTRIVAATNRGLRDMVIAGRFRADLYYRLAGVEIIVPPLRARREDIPLLVEHFIGARSGVKRWMSHRAQEALSAYDWPGNVRQLARVVERAIALAACPQIELDDLPDDIRFGYTAIVGEPGRRETEDDTSLRSWSSRYARLVLARCDGNKRRACTALDISYHTLQTYLEYGRARDAVIAEVVRDESEPQLTES
jgi:transcriptional regulator with PAS, ATPase and Fis domain